MNQGPRCVTVYWLLGIVRQLLDKGADTEAKVSHSGETALWVAATNENAAIVGLLLESGADMHAKNEDGETLLQWATTAQLETIVELISAKTLHRFRLGG
ncbi:hypothetical protein NLG97_g10089 [Lecanicillium saksenae]|uniref:Uncharacterized protein n=1 Tax=Lecanicillium saksenae TaxID=468837 RepID=A0ACC1QGX7_9HYPO|nr:hypothetical protein NLG97_g10089 [Lecanicillium saksenae]